MSTTSLASTVVQMTSAARSQQVGVAVARQQIASDRAVADLVAQGAASAAAGSPAAPPGQGQAVDIKV